MKEGFVITNFQTKSIHIMKLWNVLYPDIPSPTILNYESMGNSFNEKLGVINGDGEDVPEGAYGEKEKADTSKVPVPKSITVHLLANGNVVQTKVITAEDNWECEFKGIPVYDENGREIEYKFIEEPIKGYKTTYSYDVYNNYDNYIINKSIFDISVEKKWVGKDKDEVEIQLYRDYEKTEFNNDTGNKVKVPVKGELVDTVKLNKANSWKYTFKDLEEYFANEFGNSKYKYYIKEKEIDGYKTVITGDEDSGYIITNIDKSKMSIPVEKIWKGKAADKVEVVLKADGVEKETIILNGANDWKHTFENLDRLNDNYEVINYTIEEKTIDGYNSVIEQKDADDITKGIVITNSENSTPQPNPNPNPDPQKPQPNPNPNPNPQKPQPDPEPNLNPVPQPNPEPQPKAEQPNASIPQTGIDSNVIMSLGLMGLSGIGLGVFGRKKR